MQNSSRRDVLTRGGAAAALAVTGAVVGGADGAMAFAEPSKELDRLQRLDHLDVFCASNGLLVAAVVIDGRKPIEDGDLVAWQWGGDKIMFSEWGAPNGRDSNGRFVPRGDPRECASLDGLRYCPNDTSEKLRWPIKVLGRVVIGKAI